MRASPRLANDAWEALLTAHASLMRQLAADDVWCDVSMREYDVLYTLAKCRGPVRLTALNEHVLLSQPALSRLVDRLAARGLVQRETDPGDGRGLLLSLTAAGRERQRAVGRRHAASVARAFSTRLDREGLQQLQQLCEALASTSGVRDSPVAHASTSRARQNGKDIQQ